MDAHAQLDGFIDKFAPELAAQARAMVAHMTARLPGATILAYDNYNALAVAFGAGERMSEIVLSLAVYPRWVSLFFARGVELPDPDGMLAGDGGKMRHIRLSDPEMLADPRIETLIAAALAIAEPRIDTSAPGRLVIKSVAAKQRPRRPA